MLNKNVIGRASLVLMVTVCGIVSLLASNRVQTLADVRSPTGEWGVKVQGRKLLFGAIEVTAAVQTHDGREISLGVIDLRPGWAEAEQQYQAHKTAHTRIDEVKAVVGGEVLLRDDYFPGIDHEVSGTIDGKAVRLRLGEVNRDGFHFMSGLTLGSIGGDEHLSVLIPAARAKLAEGVHIEVDGAAEGTSASGTMLDLAWNVESSGFAASTAVLRVASLMDGFSLSLVIDEVTPHLVIGSLRVTAEAPQIDLQGSFRLVNRSSPVARSRTE